MNAITSRWGARFYASLVAQHVTPAMINYFCRRWSSTALTPSHSDEMDELHQHMAIIQPHVLPDHRLSGLKFLADKRRQKKWRQQFGDADLWVLSANPTIQWVDTVSTCINWHDDCRPIFRVQAEEMYFDYWMRPWQSGEHFEIYRNARYV